jgi:general secretion pathway protein A
MYLEHFGLNAPPFQFTASPMALFMSRTHREALAALEWGLLHEPSGLTLLIGDGGTGKTTLVCALLARQYREVRAAYLGNPKLSFEELMGSILSQLGIRGGRANKAAMLNAYRHFAHELPLNERIAVLIDEAQLLSDEALEELRLLSNLERHGRKATQMVLAGQYELARRLAEPSMRHLNERIGARAVLLPLTPLECRDYIQHRLRLCGSNSDTIFARNALDFIVRHGGGVPRRINALCHNSLLLAYSAESKRVTLAMAREAVADYAALSETANSGRRSARFLERTVQGARSIRPVLGLGLLGIAGFVSGQLEMNHNPVHHLRSWAMPQPVAPPETAGVPVEEIGSKIEASATAAKVSGVKPRRDEPLSTIDPPGAASEGGNETSVIKADVLAPGESVSAAAAPASKPEKPAANSASASASEPRSERPFVVVARGDTLGAIAIRRLGSIEGVRSLMRLNPGITDAAHVYPGEIIYLPFSAVASSSPNPDETDLE